MVNAVFTPSESSEENQRKTEKEEEEEEKRSDKIFLKQKIYFISLIKGFQRIFALKILAFQAFNSHEIR